MNELMAKWHELNGAARLLFCVGILGLATACEPAPPPYVSIVTDKPISSASTTTIPVTGLPQGLRSELDPACTTFSVSSGSPITAANLVMESGFGQVRVVDIPEGVEGSFSGTATLGRRVLIGGGCTKEAINVSLAGKVDTRAPLCSTWEGADEVTFSCNEDATIRSSIGRVYTTDSDKKVKASLPNRSDEFIIKDKAGNETKRTVTLATHCEQDSAVEPTWGGGAYQVRIKCDGPGQILYNGSKIDINGGGAWLPFETGKKTASASVSFKEKVTQLSAQLGELAGPVLNIKGVRTQNATHTIDGSCQTAASAPAKIKVNDVEYPTPGPEGSLVQIKAATDVQSLTITCTDPKGDVAGTNVAVRYAPAEGIGDPSGKVTRNSPAKVRLSVPLPDPQQNIDQAKILVTGEQERGQTKTWHVQIGNVFKDLLTGRTTSEVTCQLDGESTQELRVYTCPVNEFGQIIMSVRVADKQGKLIYQTKLNIPNPDQSDDEQNMANIITASFPVGALAVGLTLFGGLRRRAFEQEHEREVSRYRTRLETELARFMRPYSVYERATILDEKEQMFKHLVKGFESITAMGVDLIGDTKPGSTPIELEFADALFTTAENTLANLSRGENGSKTWVNLVAQTWNTPYGQPLLLELRQLPFLETKRHIWRRIQNRYPVLAQQIQDIYILYEVNSEESNKRLVKWIKNTSGVSLHHVVETLYNWGADKETIDRIFSLDSVQFSDFDWMNARHIRINKQLERMPRRVNIDHQLANTSVLTEALSLVEEGNNIPKVIRINRRELYSRMYQWLSTLIPDPEQGNWAHVVERLKDGKYVQYNAADALQSFLDIALHDKPPGLWTEIHGLHSDYLYKKLFGLSVAYLVSSPKTNARDLLSFLTRSKTNLRTIVEILISWKVNIPKINRLLLDYTPIDEKTVSAIRAEYGIS